MIMIQRSAIWLLTFWLICLICLIWLLTGCTGSQVKPLDPTSASYPSWFTHPNQTDASELVGVGEGETRDEAIQSALVDLLSQLSIEVAARFETRLSVHQQDVESVERVSEKRIQASVAQSEIRQYQVKQLKRLAYDKTVALVSVSRDQLFRDIQTQFQQDLAGLKSKQQAQSSNTRLAKYLFYQHHLTQVEDLQQQLKVLASLNKGFVDKEASRYLQAFDEMAWQLKRQIVFYLDADTESQKLVPIIENALTQAGFQVETASTTENLTRPGQNSMLMLRSKLAVSEAYGFKIVRLTLSNRVLSGEQQLGGEVWTFKGQALVKEDQALDLALQRIAQKAQQQIEQQGLNTFLGLELIR